ncbi:MAG TPA: sigma 54-interacting transcriptional regulator, partial [Polyangia bacterium]
NHPSVSRHHALLRVGGRVEIEDLGSANGVRLHDRRLLPGRPVEVAVGELVELGQVMLFLRRATATARPRRVWPHGYFEARVEEQVTRAERTTAPFAVVRLGLKGTPPASAIDEAFATLRPLDVLAQYAPNEYELLLPDTPPEEIEALVAGLRAPLEQRGVKLRVGVACYPLDGTAPETLIAHACDAVAGDEDDETGPIAETAEEGGAMRLLRRLATQVAASDLCVLIQGETGVGKEVMAETLHRMSPRASRKFLRLHCAAFTETLLESELFGHERGAFTGAHAAKPGLLETASGGTVLLDEIGELPMATQVKLLRVLEDQKVLRVGGIEPRSIDVRFIAATNRDLEAEVAAGRFRSDLYFRLNGVTLWIPPLRERLDEIEPLARQFVGNACRRLKRAEESPLTPDAVKRLRAYGWPGNIRELRNTIERAVLLCGRGPIRVEHLPTEKMGATLLQPPPPKAPPQPPPPTLPATTAPGGDATPIPPGASARGLHGELDAIERQRILDAVAQCGGNQSRAARMLGISRNTLAARLDAYGVPRPRKP